MRSVAYVVRKRDHVAEVVLGRHIECKQCGGCIGAMSSKERRLEAINEIGADVGQKVEIEIEPRHAVSAAFVMFVLPVLSALGLGFAGSYVAGLVGLRRDVGGIVAGALGVMLAFLLLRHLERSGRGRIPRITRLVPAGDEPEGRC